jgi:hypothetical protein
MSFVEKLDNASLAAFNAASKNSFSEQCQFFLNAFWNEYGSQAEFIFAVHYDVMCKAEMHAQGLQYVHQYTEGNDVDFDIGLYFFEKLCKFVEENGLDKEQKSWCAEHKDFKSEFKASIPQMMTAIVRKKELREKVDINFDGRVSMLEFLLYQYNASPKDLMDRAMSQPDEPEEVRKAKQALAEVNKRIAAYEAEKLRLEEGSKLPGVKGLTCKNQLAQLGASPLWEQLNKALITAEAAVRIAVRKYGAGSGYVGGAGGAARTDGSLWWMQRDLNGKKAKYQKKA